MINMDWISIKDREPTPKDSPILAISSLDYFSVSALHYIEGWDGLGWYESNDEYGIGLHKDEAHYHDYSGMIYWMPLPSLPKE